MSSGRLQAGRVVGSGGAADLAVEALAAGWPGRPVLSGVSFTAAAGSVTALLGINGAGKSTLLRALAGVLPAVAGRILVGGEALAGLAPRERARRVAWVPQRSLPAGGNSARNVVAMGRFAHQGLLARLSTADAAAIAGALAAVDALALAERPFRTLSAGEQQRVLLARALATGAPVLLLDEPTAALDLGHALDLLALLRRLAGEGRCVIAALHDLEQARTTADRALLLHDGGIAAAGAVPAVLAAPAFAAGFGVAPVAGAACGWRRLP